MKAVTIAPLIAGAVKEYLAMEEAYGDDAVLAVNPATESVELLEEEPADAETSPIYYVRVMDLVRMSAAHPGQWQADSEAIADLAADIAD